MKLLCSLCGKKLSKKTARNAGARILCSPCLFGQPPKPQSEDRS